MPQRENYFKEHSFNEDSETPYLNQMKNTRKSLVLDLKSGKINDPGWALAINHGASIISARGDFDSDDDEIYEDAVDYHEEMVMQAI